MAFFAQMVAKLTLDYHFRSQFLEKTCLISNFFEVKVEMLYDAESLWQLTDEKMCKKILIYTTNADNSKILSFQNQNWLVSGDTWYRIWLIIIRWICFPVTQLSSNDQYSSKTSDWFVFGRFGRLYKLITAWEEFYRCK